MLSDAELRAQRAEYNALKAEQAAITAEFAAGADAMEIARRSAENSRGFATLARTIAKSLRREADAPG